MLRAALLGFLAIWPVAAAAQVCGTVDLIAELGDADRARLDAFVAPHPYPVGNFWRADKEGSTVIVAGTLHVPDPRFDEIVERLKPALMESDLLVIEATKKDEAGLATLAAEMPGMFFITEGPTLIDLLGPDEWAMTEARLADLGIPGFLGAKFQPWYMNLTLAVPSCAMSAMQAGERGLDRRLEGLAEEAGVPIASLDDAAALLRLFADEPLEDQLDGLRLTLRSQQDDGAANTSTLVEAYFDGRTREGWEFARIQIENAGVENGLEMFEEVDEALLVGRNIEWEPKIAALVEGKDALIAVGAAHLSGETGVLRSLERAGYEIAPY